MVFDAFGYRTLTPAARRRAADQIVISSGLWGLLRPGDLIPAYRLSGAVALPGVGTLARMWRDAVSRELGESAGLVVDLRSSAYVALGPVPPDTADRSATVRVLTERGGKRTVVSHSNKSTKGRIARSLVSARRSPTDVDELAESIAAAGYRVERSDSRSGRPSLLDIIVRAEDLG